MQQNGHAWKHESTKDSTIYNYTLLSKLSTPGWLQLLYWSIPCYVAIIEYINYQRFPIIQLFVGFCLIQLLHYWIIRIELSARKDAPLKSWSFISRGIWIGYLPEKNTAFRRLWTFQLHLTLIGMAIIALLYPWLDPITFLNLLFVHGWILCPRLFILWRFLRKSSSGLVKINSRDTSYYLQ
jgi:hypothetical protein